MRVKYELGCEVDLSCTLVFCLQLTFSATEHGVAAFGVGLFLNEHVPDDHRHLSHHRGPCDTTSTTCTNRLVPLLHDRVATQHVLRDLSEQPTRHRAPRLGDMSASPFAVPAVANTGSQSSVVCKALATWEAFCITDTTGQCQRGVLSTSGDGAKQFDFFDSLTTRNNGFFE